MADEGAERRHEDRELARWQGQVESQLATVKSDVHELTTNVTIIDRTVTRMEGRIEALQHEVNENRVETRGLSSTIGKARDDVVQEFKTAERTRASTRTTWKITWVQLLVGAVVGFVVAVVPVLMTLAITGQLG